MEENGPFVNEKREDTGFPARCRANDFSRGIVAGRKDSGAFAGSSTLDAAGAEVKRLDGAPGAAAGSQ
jgi:hypothetical protein